MEVAALDGSLLHTRSCHEAFRAEPGCGAKLATRGRRFSRNSPPRGALLGAKSGGVSVRESGGPKHAQGSAHRNGNSRHGRATGRPSCDDMSGRAFPTRFPTPSVQYKTPHPIDLTSLGVSVQNTKHAPGHKTLT